MADSERMYVVLDRIESKLESNHLEVVQRLTKLETVNHRPEDCPGVLRVERAIEKHIESDKASEKENWWRGWGKEVLKLAAAAGAGFVGSKG